MTLEGYKPYEKWLPWGIECCSQPKLTIMLDETGFIFQGACYACSRGFNRAGFRYLRYPFKMLQLYR